MSTDQTDRQTIDTTQRGSWWLVTVNNYNEDELLKAKTQLKWMKSSAGQCEVGEECKTPHFHVLINSDFCRWSAIKEWMPRANIKIANTKEAIANFKNYVQKPETYVEGTRWNVSFRGVESLSFQACMLKLCEHAWTTEQILAKVLIKVDDATGVITKPLTLKETYTEEYHHCVSKVCEEDLGLLAIYMCPNYERAWKHQRKVCMYHFEREQQTTIMYSENKTIQL